MGQIERLIQEAKVNLERGRAVATGVGRFALVINYDGDPLLRRRLEKDSLLSEDLSGKWEMTGGGMELNHFPSADAEEPTVSRYQRPILATLRQELEEEAGLKLVSLFSVVEVPAFIDSINKKDSSREAIDDAAVIPISFSACEETEKFRSLLAKGGLKFVSRDKLAEIEIVSPRTRFLIEKGLAAYDLIYRK